MRSSYLKAMAAKRNFGLGAEVRAQLGTAPNWRLEAAITGTLEARRHVEAGIFACQSARLPAA